MVGGTGAVFLIDDLSSVLQGKDKLFFCEFSARFQPIAYLLTDDQHRWIQEGAAKSVKHPPAGATSRARTEHVEQPAHEEEDLVACFRQHFLSDLGQSLERNVDLFLYCLSQSSSRSDQLLDMVLEEAVFSKIKKTFPGKKQ